MMKILSSVVNKGKLVDNILKKVVASNSISEETSIKLVGTKPNIMNGICKCHKYAIGNCPPFRRILSASNTPTNKLANF